MSHGVRGGIARPGAASQGENLDMTDVTIVEFDVRESVVVEVLGHGRLCWTGAERNEQMAVVGNGVEVLLKSDRE